MQEVVSVINSQYIEDFSNKRIECPSCSQGRKKKNQRTLSLTREGNKVLYQCWHCQLSGVVDMNKKNNLVEKKVEKITPLKISKTASQRNGKNKFESKMLTD